MTAIINIDKFRFYFGQSPNQHIYDASFDSTKVDTTLDIQNWKLSRSHEHGDTINITLSNPDNRYKDDFPIQFGYGAEVIYVTDGTNIESAEAITNWSETGSNLTGPTLEENQIREKTASVNYSVTGTINAGTDTIDIVNLNSSLGPTDEIELWLRSSRALAIGAVSLNLYKTVIGFVLADTIVSLNAVTANEWTRIRFDSIGSLVVPFTLTKIEVYPNDTPTWLSGDIIYCDLVYAIRAKKWLLKGEFAPIDFSSGPSKNILDIEARGIGRFTLNGMVSRDYLRNEWYYAEDILYDIVYNLTNLNSAYGIEGYMPDDTTKLEDAVAEDKHPLVTDIRLRNLNIRDAINNVTTVARIGYYFHADADTGELRMTLKSRATTIADYVLDSDYFELGKIIKKEYNEDALSKVIVIGKDNVSATQSNRTLIDAGYTNTKVIKDSNLTTVYGCAERAHYELVKSSPDDEVVNISLNPSASYQDSLLYAEPYEVVELTDDDVDIDHQNYNIVELEIRIDRSISIDWTLGEIYKQHWLRYYDATTNETNADTTNPIHYRTATANVSISCNHHVFSIGNVGGTCTFTEIGKKELTSNFTKAFFRFADTGQRLQYCYVVNDGGTIQVDKGQLYQDIWFTLDDTDKKVRLYIPFDWVNNTGSQKTIDYFYPVVTETTELIEDIAEADTTIKLKSAAGALANKQFDIVFRNSARVIYSSSITDTFSVEYGDYGIFKNNDEVEIQFPDGTTGSAIITMDTETVASQLISKASGDLPTVGSVIYIDGTETVTVSSVVFGDDYDTITATTGISRSVQRGAKVEKFFNQAVTHADAMNRVVANGNTLRIFMTLTLTSDTTETDYNSSYVTKEGLLFLANQLIGDTTLSFRRQFKSQILHGAIGLDNTAALSYTWMDSYKVEMELAAIWVGSALTVDTYSGSVTSITANQTVPKEFDDSAITGAWIDCNLTFSSGDNNGVTRTITTYAGTTITLDTALPYFPAVGDTFYIEYPVEVGDFVYYDSGNTFTGVSGSTETKTAFLKVVDFTGGPPRNTIQLEDDQNLGLNPAATDSVFLIGNETISSEIYRSPASNVVVAPAYDIDTYALKFLTEFNDVGIGPETANGAATGNLNEIQEFGIFTEDAIVESSLQYYLDNVAFDGRSTQLGHGDDPYDNLTGRSLKSHQNIPPRSDNFSGTYNIKQVKGFRGINIHAPVKVWFGVAFDLVLSRGPISILSHGLGYIDITNINNYENNLLTYDSGRFYQPYDLIDRRNRVGAVATSVAAAWGLPRFPYVIHEFIFRLPEDMNKDHFKSLTLNWAGVSNRPIKAYILKNTDWSRNANAEEWTQFKLKSAFGIDSAQLESINFGERFFSGSADYSTDLWQIANSQGYIYIIVVAGDPDFGGTALPYLMTDIAYISYSIENLGFEQGQGTFRKGIDYYYDITTPEYLWWDFVDPVEFVADSTGAANSTDNGLVTIPVPDILSYTVGMKVFLENDDGDTVSSRILSIGENHIVVEPSFVNPFKFSGDNAIYTVQFHPTEKVTIGGKEYTKQLPGKSIISDLFGGMEGSNNILAYEGFENGIETETVSLANTTLSEISGLPVFTTSGSKVGNLACDIVGSGDYVSITADTSNLDYLAAHVLTDVVTVGNTADVQVLLLDVSNNICAGVRFWETGGQQRMYYYTADAWAYSDGAEDYNYQWDYNDPMQVQFLFDMSSGRYQVYINGISITDNPVNDLYIPENTNIVPTKLRLLNNNGTDTFWVDEMFLGYGNITEFSFPIETAASFSESSYRKRGYGQYLPSELHVRNIESSVDYYNSALYEDLKVIKQCVIEDVGNEKLHLSVIDENVYTTTNDFLKISEYVADTKNPLDLTFDDVNVVYGVRADAANMRLYRSTNVVGEAYYGATPAYGTPETDGVASTIRVKTRTMRNCRFEIMADGSAGVNMMAEVWSREGNNKFGYLSGVLYHSGTGDSWKMIHDQGSTIFPLEHATVGCVNLYQQNLTPGANDKMAEKWDNDPVYNLVTSDDFIIIDEEYQSVAGIPRFQPNMQISVSDVGADPNPSTEVEHFLVRKVEAWPRQSIETWEAAGAASYVTDDNIISDWMWLVAEGGSGQVTTDVGKGYRTDGRLILTTTASGSDFAYVLNTTRLANRQSFRCYVKGATNANGYIRFIESLALFQVTFSDGDIKVGAVTLDSFPDSDTYMEITVEFDYGGTNGYGKVYTKEVGNAGTETESDWIAFTNNGEVTRIEISSNGLVGNGTTLYVSQCEIFGGDRSSTKLYVHLMHTTNADRRLASGYTVAGASFRLWKWMHDRASFNPIWVNPYVGLKQQHTAEINMVYERGANYTVEYLKGDGLCVVRSRLQATSQDHPIRLRPKERLSVVQEIGINFE